MSMNVIVPEIKIMTIMDNNAVRANRVTKSMLYTNINNLCIYSYKRNQKPFFLFHNRRKNRHFYTIKIIFKFQFLFFTKCFTYFFSSRI